MRDRARLAGWLGLASLVGSPSEFITVTMVADFSIFSSFVDFRHLYPYLIPPSLSPRGDDSCGFRVSIVRVSIPVGIDWTWNGARASPSSLCFSLFLSSTCSRAWPDTFIDSEDGSLPRTLFSRRSLLKPISTGCGAFYDRHDGDEEQKDRKSPARVRFNATRYFGHDRITWTIVSVQNKSRKMAQMELSGKSIVFFLVNLV